MGAGTRMCQCTPEIRTPFCGKPGCEWPKQDMPWCDSCQSYHHPDNPTCKLKAKEDDQRYIKDLESALMVYDATLFCLVAGGEVSELFMGQVRAAAEAHQHVMGEPSMLVENRAGKNYLEKNDASGR